jgi:hypothetical protein
MFYIDIADPKIKAAKDTHVEKLTCLVNKRIGGRTCKANCAICTSALGRVHRLNPPLRNFLLDPKKLETILSGTPAQLFSVSEQFWTAIIPGYDYQTWLPCFNKKLASKTSTHSLKNQAKRIQWLTGQLNKIFNYDWFCEKGQRFYNAYELAENLDRQTCTYCNRTYTSTVIHKRNNTKITRPSFDHWFPKSEFPVLALSFHNLIPSCTSCNSSVKGAKRLDLIGNSHPYVDVNQTKDFEFNYFFSPKLSKYRIFIKNTSYGNTKSADTLKALYVDEVYNAHLPELKDLITIKTNYSLSYIKSMHALLNGRLTKQEVYRLLFGTEYDTKDFYKRPLSKFKFDILKQLEMLDEMN